MAELRRKDAGGGKVQAEGGGDDPTAKIDDAVKKAVEAVDKSAKDAGAGEGGVDNSPHSPDPEDQVQNVREVTDSADDSPGGAQGQDDGAQEEAVKDESAKAETEEPKKGTAAEPAATSEPSLEGSGREAEQPSEGEKPKKAPAKKPAAKPKAKEKAEKPVAAAPVYIRASAKYVRVAPRKARLIADQVRGMHIDEARALLAFSPRSAALDIKKLIESAAANAENNHELIADEMKVSEITVDEGPIIKRFRPRAQGRATRINKRTSHISVALSPEE